MNASRIHLAALSMLLVLMTACASQAPPASGADDSASLKAAIERLNALLSQHDIALVNEFAPDADILFLGSRGSERFVEREKIRGFFEGVFARPGTIKWDWKETKTSSAGDIGWVFATGDMVVMSADGEMRRPYRMTGVLQRRDGSWKWRQFHGSEPIDVRPADAGR